MFDAIRGYNEEFKERVDIFLYGVREIAYYAAAPHVKNFKKTDIMKLDIDKEIRKKKLKGMKPIKVTIDGKEQ